MIINPYLINTTLAMENGVLISMDHHSLAFFRFLGPFSPHTLFLACCHLTQRAHSAGRAFHTFAATPGTKPAHAFGASREDAP
jgi:hypothetical protein